MRAEKCACGGVITVGDPADDRLVMAQVRLHQQTPRHEEWRRLGGLAYDPELKGREFRRMAA